MKEIHSIHIISIQHHHRMDPSQVGVIFIYFLCSSHVWWVNFSFASGFLDLVMNFISDREARWRERERDREIWSVVEEVNRWQRWISSLHANDTQAQAQKDMWSVFCTHAHASQHINENMKHMNESSQNENKPRTHTHTHSHTLMMANNFSTKKHENRFRLIEGVAIATISCWAVPYQLRITDAFHQPIFYFTFALWLDGFEMLCVKGTSDE